MWGGLLTPMKDNRIADRQTIDMILDVIPHKHPFRFIDDILELSEEHIEGIYRFKGNEYFFGGHFPDHPVTPGVILVEAMAQTGIVALGLYLIMKENGLSMAQLKNVMTFFTNIEEVEFTKIVMPDEDVVLWGDKVYFRQGKIMARTRMERRNGEIVCSGILAGMGVWRER